MSEDVRELPLAITFEFSARFMAVPIETFERMVAERTRLRKLLRETIRLFDTRQNESCGSALCERIRQELGDE